MWRIQIDTGGTFTDGVAHAPDGRVHRAKILSTSALRGIVERRIADRVVEVRERWSADAELIRGLIFRRLDEPERQTRVVSFDDDRNPRPPHRRRTARALDERRQDGGLTRRRGAARDGGGANVRSGPRRIHPSAGRTTAIVQP